ncbi:MAG: ShlB/FhaC/HecB family hemolysin secretion/activation protein [Chlorobiaceae bacterium]
MFVALGPFLFAASLQARVVPDAGSILRDQQLRQNPQPQQLPSSEGTTDHTTVPGSGVQVMVKGFVFSGYEGIVTEGELQSITASYVGKKISYNGLQSIVDKVTAFLKKKGWFLAKAYLPKQDVTSGIIEIAVHQGKSDGSLSIKKDKSVRMRTKILQSVGELAIQRGQPLNEQQLERSVLLMNDLPGINAQASLAPGTIPNSSGVEISVTEGPLFSGSVWADNQGNYYTGAWRGNTMFSINDPLRYGDQMTLLLTEASGLTQGRVGYSFPLHRNGFRGNLAYTGMRYELGGELSGENYKGRSNTIDAGFSYSMFRSRTSNLTTSISCGYKTLVDTKSDIALRDKQLRSATFSLSGDRNDHFYGGGYTSVNMGLTTGSLRESVQNTQNSYTRLNLGATRVQRLAQRVNLDVSLSAQRAMNNLDSSEKFSLGGPNSVRAYPVGEGAGDEGQLISTNLRYSMPVAASLGSFQTSCFFDAGRVTLQKNEGVSSGTATNLNNYWIQGAGLGFNYSYLAKFALRGSWAHVIGDNPGRSVTGNNSDGHNDKSRFWLQAMAYF